MEFLEKEETSEKYKLKGLPSDFNVELAGELVITVAEKGRHYGAGL